MNHKVNDLFRKQSKCIGRMDVLNEIASKAEEFKDVHELKTWILTTRFNIEQEEFNKTSIELNDAIKEARETKETL